MLSGCQQMPVRTETHTVNIPVYIKPPAALTAQVPEPTIDGATNADLAQWALSLRAALEQANAQLRAIAGLTPQSK
jgi:hypothetical protein